MATTRLDIVSAEREIFSGPVEMVYAPAREGDVGITPRHTAMITTLKPGEVRAVHEGGEEESFYVSGGILEVQPHVVTVLSDTASRAEDVDEAAALAAKEQAEHALQDRKADIDYAAARAQLAEAAAQLQAIQRLRRRTGRS
ncbi:MAG: F0F1 ATP synthase subunit epsilon [Gammaproteobacteria bacterium]|nr:F0F1 ATP synthase subunit epsilon [Gammaproteobacteria bacterium]